VGTFFTLKKNEGYVNSLRLKRWVLGVRGVDPLSAAVNALSTPPGDYGRSEIKLADPNRLGDQSGGATCKTAEPEKTDGAARCSWGSGL